jgi:hypothetical protein
VRRSHAPGQDAWMQVGAHHARRPSWLTSHGSLMRTRCNGMQTCLRRRIVIRRPGSRPCRRPRRSRSSGAAAGRAA